MGNSPMRVELLEMRVASLFGSALLNDTNLNKNKLTKPHNIYLSIYIQIPAHKLTNVINHHLLFPIQQLKCLVILGAVAWQIFTKHQQQLQQYYVIWPSYKPPSCNEKLQTNQQPTTRKILSLPANTVAPIA